MTPGGPMSSAGSPQFFVNQTPRYDGQMKRRRKRKRKCRGANCVKGTYR